MPALAVQITYVAYSINTLLTIPNGPVAPDFDSRIDVPGGVPFHLSWILLTPSVVLAIGAVVGMARERGVAIHQRHPYFLGFVWALGAIYTFSYGTIFITVSPSGNGMLLVSGCLMTCALTAVLMASAKSLRSKMRAKPDKSPRLRSVTATVTASQSVTVDRVLHE